MNIIPKVGINPTINTETKPNTGDSPSTLELRELDSRIVISKIVDDGNVYEIGDEYKRAEKFVELAHALKDKEV